MDLTPKPLPGRFITLEPIAETHREDLRRAAMADRKIFAYMPLNIADEFDLWFDQSLNAGPVAGHMVFIVRWNEAGALVGSSRYLNISKIEPRLEIGYTWYAPAFHGTSVNPEAKLLLMSYAFEELGCARVELKTDALNARSRAAMEKMGAKYEGTLRRHMATQGGRIRDSAYFSVLDSEWPEVKQGLQARVDAHSGAEA